MHTVARTRPFDIAAKASGMSEDEIDDLINFLAENPEAGDEMSGTGGCRKVRVGGRGKGKSGGYRTVSFYSGDKMPVFLLTVFSKGERSKSDKSRICSFEGDIKENRERIQQQDIRSSSKKGMTK